MGATFPYPALFTTTSSLPKCSTAVATAFSAAKLLVTSSGTAMYAVAAKFDQIGESLRIAGRRDQTVTAFDDSFRQRVTESARTSGDKPSTRHNSSLVFVAQ